MRPHHPSKQTRPKIPLREHACSISALQKLRSGAAARYDTQCVVGKRTQQDKDGVGYPHGQMNGGERARS
ncbi:hypothetical protein AG1IA_04541 [Rhizoctonia solani AG-1 IA]|uniref:Uncharacterized protein n=1 Tax=Thanatephorus cucumeris (strain AG1-IA) TaxID=983506 RepID=L8WYI6_THACA|nr:hypothetical protein AG1IA_04541 [Rhizoctonia solani AG-1 IA]